MREPVDEHKRLEDSAWLDERIAFEKRPENQIVVEIPPKRWHPALLAVRDDLTATAKGFAEILGTPVPKPRKTSRRGGSVAEPYDRARSIEQDGKLLIRRTRAHCLRVSLLTYERALAIANELLFAAEARQFEVAHDQERGRMVLKIESAKFGMALRERQEARFEPTTYGSTIRHFEATNELFIFIERPSFSSFEMRDRSDEPIEDQLNNLFCRLYPDVIVQRQRAREDADNAARAALARERYEALSKRRAMEAAAKDAEQTRRVALADEAHEWRKAEDIRSYIKHLTDLGTIDDAWSKWASAVADEMDPSRKRLT